MTVFVGCIFKSQFESVTSIVFLTVLRFLRVGLIKQIKSF